MQDSRSIPLLVGLLAGCTVYLAAMAIHPTLICYLPERGEWAFAAPKGEIAMHYYGMPPLGLAGFAVGWGLARARGVRRFFEGAGPARILAALALIAVASSLAYAVMRELLHWAAL